MSTELPKPFGLGEPAPKPPGIKVQAVQFEEMARGQYIVEYGKKDNKYIFHFFKTGPFSMGFRAKVYRNFVGGFNLYGRENELLKIDWIPEFDSWCVMLTDVLSMTPPPSENAIKQVLEDILS